MADSAAAETKYCSNCKKDISANNFTMHEVHCRRHIVLCTQCAEPVPRSEMDDHFEEHHAKVKCDLCGTELEKTQLKEHMDSTCTKKPIRCPYCELELPRSDLNSHQDYCGTRTEACFKCGQFIMKKDQLQHEASNCEYPLKQSTTGQSSERDRLFDLPELDSHFASPFAMTELSRIIDSSHGYETLNPAMDIAGFGRPRIAPRIEAKSYTNNNTSRSKKNTTNRRSEVNKQRQQVLETDMSDSTDETADRLLAMRLQQEDDEELVKLIKQIEKESPAQTPVSPTVESPSDPNTFPDDDDMIPCEFCGEPFPIDMLVQHQSGCDPLLSGQYNESPTWRSERNNEVSLRSRTRGTNIPVINNLDTDWSSTTREVPIQSDWSSTTREIPIQSDWSSTTREIPIQREWEPTPPASPPSYDMLDEQGEVILPCEFCGDPFPFELLIQHQSVCDQNSTMTPRTMTPAETTRWGRRAIPPTDESRSRSQKHQGAPTWVGDFDDSDDDVIDHLASGSSRNGDTVLQANPRSVASKYGAPSNHFDDYLTKVPRTRVRIEVETQASVSDKNGRSRNPRRGSDARTRSTLDQLLNETETEHDLLGAASSRKKAAKNEDNYIKKGTKKKSSTGTTTYARDVMRELHRPPNSSVMPKPRKRTNGTAEDIAPPQFDIRPVGEGRRQQHTSRPANSNTRSTHNAKPRSRNQRPGRPFFDDDNL